MAYRSEKIAVIVDDLISRAMAYNETLHSDYSLSDFDFAADRLCLARRKLIRWLKKL